MVVIGDYEVDNLLTSCRRRQVARALNFLNEGADVNAVDLYEQATPLHFTCLYCDNITTLALLNRGAPVNVKDINSNSPLHNVCRSGSEESKTLPMEVCYDNPTEIAKALLEHGADLHSLDKEGRTPLHVASFHGEKDLVTLLLDKGADAHLMDISQRTALHISCLYGHKDIASILLSQGADVNSRDCSLATPLHAACQSGSTELIKDLIDKGAGLEIKDVKENTALHWACANRYRDVAVILIEKGADINSIGEDGRTPLHLAYSNNDWSLIVDLLKNGANVHVRDAYGATPLFDKKITISSSAELQGKTRLCYASEHSCKEAAIYLICQGATASLIIATIFFFWIFFCNIEYSTTKNSLCMASLRGINLFKEASLGIKQRFQ